MKLNLPNTILKNVIFSRMGAGEFEIPVFLKKITVFFKFFTVFCIFTENSVKFKLQHRILKNRHFFKNRRISKYTNETLILLDTMYKSTILSIKPDLNNIRDILI